MRKQTLDLAQQAQVAACLYLGFDPHEIKHNQHQWQKGLEPDLPRPLELHLHHHHHHYMEKARSREAGCISDSSSPGLFHFPGHPLSNNGEILREAVQPDFLVLAPVEENTGRQDVILRREMGSRTCVDSFYRSETLKYLSNALSEQEWAGGSGLINRAATNCDFMNQYHISSSKTERRFPTSGKRKKISNEEAQKSETFEAFAMPSADTAHNAKLPLANSQLQARDWSSEVQFKTSGSRSEHYLPSLGTGCSEIDESFEAESTLGRQIRCSNGFMANIQKVGDQQRYLMDARRDSQSRQENAGQFVPRRSNLQDHNKSEEHEVPAWMNVQENGVLIEKSFKAAEFQQQQLDQETRKRQASEGRLQLCNPPAHEEFEEELLEGRKEKFRLQTLLDQEKLRGASYRNQLLDVQQKYIALSKELHEIKLDLPSSLSDEEHKKTLVTASVKGDSQASEDDVNITCDDQYDVDAGAKSEDHIQCLASNSSTSKKQESVSIRSTVVSEGHIDQASVSFPDSAEVAENILQQKKLKTEGESEFNDLIRSFSKLLDKKLKEEMLVKVTRAIASIIDEGDSTEIINRQSASDSSNVKVEQGERRQGPGNSMEARSEGHPLDRLQKARRGISCLQDIPPSQSYSRRLNGPEQESSSRVMTDVAELGSNLHRSRDQTEHSFTRNQTSPHSSESLLNGYSNVYISPVFEDQRRYSGCNVEGAHQNKPMAIASEEDHAKFERRAVSASFEDGGGYKDERYVDGCQLEEAQLNRVSAIQKNMLATEQGELRNLEAAVQNLGIICQEHENKLEHLDFGEQHDVRHLRDHYLSILKEISRHVIELHGSLEEGNRDFGTNFGSDQAKAVKDNSICEQNTNNETKVIELAEEIKTKEKALHYAEECNQRLASEMSKTEAALDMLRLNYTELESSLEAEVKEAKSDMQVLQVTTTKMKEDLTRSESRTAALEESLLQRDLEIQQGKQKLCSIRKEVDNALLEKYEVVRRMHEFKKDADEQRQRTDELVAINDELLVFAQGKEAELALSNRQATHVKVTQEENAQLRQEMEIAKAEIKKQDAVYLECSSKLAETEYQLAQREEALKRLTSHLASTIESQDSILEETEQLHAFIRNAEFQESQKDDQLRQSRMVIQDLELKLLKMEEQLSEARQEVEQMKERNAFTGKTREGKGHDDVLSCMLHDAGDMRWRVQQLEEEILEKEGQIAILRSSFPEEYDSIF